MIPTWFRRLDLREEIPAWFRRLDLSRELAPWEQPTRRDGLGWVVVILTVLAGYCIVAFSSGPAPS